MTNAEEMFITAMFMPTFILLSLIPHILFLGVLYKAYKVFQEKYQLKQKEFEFRRWKNERV